jgi:hypothetical protein
MLYDIRTFRWKIKMDKRLLIIILLIIVIVLVLFLLDWFGIINWLPGVGHDSGEGVLPSDFWRK